VERTMYPLIERKKNGESLKPEDWHWIVNSFTSGDLPAYQMAALLMAVWFRGLTFQETMAFTEAMMNSGVCHNFASFDKPAIDKHSTGGVGDKVSLALAPLAAACGVAVPMVSGRGLGHTGGTLDKLASIPGYSISLSPEKFRAQLEKIGCAIIGQSDSMAPADGMVYALRDVTATVDCVPLIAASIMSKKLAAGPIGFVFDVKVGSGAFMKTVERAEELAELLLRIGDSMGRRVTALLTRMDEPIGFTVGNALEVKEIVDLLKGEGPRDLRELTIALCSEMIELGGLQDRSSAEHTAESKLKDGSALSVFRAMVEAQGGDTSFVDTNALPEAPLVKEVTAWKTGYIDAIDAREVGFAAVELGAGRRKVDDTIDPSVGFVFKVKTGSYVETGESILEIHARDENDAETAERSIKRAISITGALSEKRPMIIRRLTL